MNMHRERKAIAAGTMFGRISIVLASVATIALLGGSAALASPIQRYAFSFSHSDTISCAQFNPAWTFSDNFTDFYDVSGQAVLDNSGNVVSLLEHWDHVSNDVNSATGFTLHEHNHFLVKVNFVAGTFTVDGVQGTMQRPGVGIVIHEAGHRVYDASGLVTSGGPSGSSDEDFCRAIA